MAIYEELVPTDAQRAQFAAACATRASREAPEFMLVDDQLFSVHLMQTALTKSYVLHTAMNAREGFARYLELAPDIVWLDIELPEINGHHLAAALNKIDPHAFVVMVTASHYTDEGAQAKRNQVKAFITKPYSKQKIRDCVQKFLTAHPERKNIHAFTG